MSGDTVGRTKDVHRHNVYERIASLNSIAKAKSERIVMRHIQMIDLLSLVLE